MKIKFTKASKHDKTLTTVSLGQFTVTTWGWVRYLNLGSMFTVLVDGQPTVFRINRVREGNAVTATTHCFPRYLRLPSISRPIHAEVTQVF